MSSYRIDKISTIVYYITAFLTPSIFLFLLYNNNRAQANLYFSQILIFAGIFAVFGLGLYIVLKLISKSNEGALILSVGFWICFWFYRNLFAVVKRVFPAFPSIVFFILICVIIIVLAVVFRFFKFPFKKVQVVFVVMSAYLIFLFFFNLVPGVSFNLSLAGTRAKQIGNSDSNLHPLIKSEFYVQPDLPHPQIHWIHLDGMMRLNTVEKYFNVSYESTREELIQRGFTINENDSLAWGSTTISLAAMLSPSLYDNFFSIHYNVIESMIFEEKDRYIDNILFQEGLSFDDIRNYELINAFITTGYEFSTVSDYTFMFWQHEDFNKSNFGYIFGIWHMSIFGELLDLLAIKTPLVLEPTYKRNQATDINDVISQAPRLSMKIIPYSHVTYFHKYTDGKMSRWEEGITAIHAYPAAVEDTIYHMFDYVDSVLEKNPDAIIVLQSDHGFHNHDTQRYLLEIGYTVEQILEMNHSVFSAVRIPEQYGGVEAPIHPLNITRVLVNRFVGENYELLSDDELFVTSRLVYG